MSRTIGLFALLLWGCPATPPGPVPTDPAPITQVPIPTGEPAPIDTDVPTPPIDSGLPRDCAALEIWADPAAVLPEHPTQLHASGGSGSIVWSLVDAPSGGMINGLTGTYLAGESVGTLDVVQGVDASCGMSATTSIQVVEPLGMEPPGGTLVFGTAFDVEATGGSSSVRCSLISTAGSSLSQCSYVAGQQEGYDVIRVEDLLTGEVVEGSFQVTTSSGFEVEIPRVVLPVGASYKPTPIGGSGSLALSSSSAKVSIVDGKMVGVAGGRASVWVEDRFLGDSVEVVVDVVDALTSVEVRDGERTVQGSIQTGDIDGDGYTDAVVATIEPSLGGWYSGAVYVYQGSATGLLPDPVQIFTVPRESASFGASIALGDFDGDGAMDLAVGADRDDTGPTDSGSVFIYSGVAGAFFEAEPSRTYTGTFSSDRLGRGVVACDFDGDGATDLAVSAYAGEDRTLSPVSTNQGMVRIYRGGAYGLEANPAMVLYGKVPEEGVFQDEGNLQLGHALAAGDWDGDGRCDLFASSHVYAFDGAGADGVVFIYGGSEDGVTSDPIRVIAINSADTSSQFGFRMATGDADGDGQVDLAVGSWNEDTSSTTAGGKVRLFKSAEVSGPATEVVDADSASLTVEATQSYDYLGLGVEFVDTDGDGLSELVVDAPYTSNPDATRGGIFAAFETTTSGVVGFDTGVVVASGSVPYAFFGMAMASLESPPGFAVLASRDPANGPEAGAVYFATETDNTELSFPGEASGGNLGGGSSLAWFDADGDGVEDLLGGAWEAAHGELGPASGHVHVFPGGALPEGELLGGQVGHSASDRFGVVVGSAGDFDGDGFDDLFVVSKVDSKPATFGAEVVNPEACPGARGQTGSVWVFRGGVAGIEAVPSFVYYPPGASDWIEAAVGGLDHNGDGKHDLVVGGARWGSSGGVGIVHGRIADPAGTTVICDANLVVHGSTNNARLGTAIVGLGDVDGDGCDEVAVGADADDLGRSNQGAVRVFWGTGGASCPTSQMVSALVGGVANARAGGRLASGDLDGDGLKELIVGMPLANGRAGRVAVVQGTALGLLVREPLVADELPLDGTAMRSEIITPGWSRDGSTGAELGEALAVLPGGRLAIGSPGVGGVEVFTFDPAGFLPRPSLIVSGREGTARIGAGLLGAREDGSWAVGAPRSDVAGLDAGAVYVIPPD